MDNYRRSSLNGFTAPAINRASQKRRDEQWISGRLTDPSTRLLPVFLSKNLIKTGAAPAPVTLSPDDLGDALDSAQSISFLGERDRRAYFAVDLASDAESIAARISRYGEFQDLRKLGALLDQEEGALLAYARAMAHWHSRHGYCGDCGSPTLSADAGHMRVCSNEKCRQPQFPRTDPAVIVLVHAEESCLLGRQPVWPKGMYSTLAGFVEPGESLEEAVMREVFEEAGVKLSEVYYHSSQPWPFPCSIMLGFTASAATGDIRLRDMELEDARWLSRDELQRALQDGTMRLPSSYSIAYRLIEDWFDAGEKGRLKRVIEG